MKIILLTILFVLPDLSIVSGDRIPGWSSLKFTTMEQCLKRSKFIFAHPENTPKWALSMGAYCHPK